jgi:hypothetical protein
VHGLKTNSRERGHFLRGYLIRQVPRIADVAIGQASALLEHGAQAALIPLTQVGKNAPDATSMSSRPISSMSRMP